MFSSNGSRKPTQLKAIRREYRQEYGVDNGHVLSGCGIVVCGRRADPDILRVLWLTPAPPCRSLSAPAPCQDAAHLGNGHRVGNRLATLLADVHAGAPWVPDYAGVRPPHAQTP